AAHRAEIEAALGAWTGARTKAELARLLGGQVPFGPVNTVADIFADPHTAARGMLAAVDHPGSRKKAVVAGTPVRMTATPGGVRRPAPILGEHSAEVLREGGFTAAEIATLEAAGAIRQWRAGAVTIGETRDED
ncbi:MAG: CoA transferase, partial [Alphaproteobacteria bacterium]|nr:CoA transferase [Alphaproteobacteria bacterium]